MILGHERQKEYFRKVLKKGTLAHAYLFHGPDGVGKFTFAKSLAEKLAGGNPHNIFLLDLEHTLLSQKEERKKIPIEDIQELKRIFSLAVPAGQWRAAIINEAEKLSDDAANAFLKLLEEPGARTVFFLITSGKDLLPSTVVSRTQGIGFSYVSARDLLAHIAPLKIDTGKREEILWLAFGRPGEMIRLVQDNAYFEQEKKFVKELEAALTGGAPQIFKFTAKAAADEDLRAKAAIRTMRFLRQSLIVHPEITLAATIKRTYKVLTTLESTNVNPRLALDVLLLEASTCKF